MSVNNSNSQGAAVASAKHRGRNAEGSVRVLGQTAAVAGISGALLLALKAMVLVSPAVLPDSDGLDALGRPNSIVDVNDSAPAPVIFAPASSPVTVPTVGGVSERILQRGTSSVSAPGPKVANETDKQGPGPKKAVPAKPADAVKTADSGVGKVAKPVTDVLDGVLGTDLGSTVDNLGSTVEKVPVVGGVVGSAGKALAPVTNKTLGKDGVLAPVVGNGGLLSSDKGLLGTGLLANDKKADTKPEAGLPILGGLLG